MDKKFVMSIAAMAALTLVSCSSDDLDSFSDNSSKNEAISFDGYLGRSAVAVNGTRGSVLEIADLKASTDGFGVFGNYKKADGQEFGANLFNNQKVKYSSTDNKWTYENTKYWPTEGHIDFLAYAPYVEDPKFNGHSSINFTVENKVADQKDLLYAKADGQTMTHNSGDNKVKFQFKHALSRLGYSVKLKKDCSADATITLKKITLAGSAPEPTTGTTTEPTGAFHKTGTIDLSTGDWTSTSDKQYFNWYSADAPGAHSVTFTFASHEPYKSTDYLFVIPQKFPTATSADKLYVIVEYTIKYTGVTDPDTHQTAIFTNKVYKQLTNNFEQGKAYMLNLTIGRPIEFDADVTPWTGEGNNETGIGIDSWDVIR